MRRHVACRRHVTLAASCLPIPLRCRDIGHHSDGSSNHFTTPTSTTSSSAWIITRNEATVPSPRAVEDSYHRARRLAKESVLELQDRDATVVKGEIIPDRVSLKKRGRWRSNEKTVGTVEGLLEMRSVVLAPLVLEEARPTSDFVTQQGLLKGKDIPQKRRGRKPKHRDESTDAATVFGPPISALNPATSVEGKEDTFELSNGIDEVDAVVDDDDDDDIVDGNDVNQGGTRQGRKVRSEADLSTERRERFERYHRLDGHMYQDSYAVAVEADPRKRVYFERCRMLLDLNVPLDVIRFLANHKPRYFAQGVRQGQHEVLKWLFNIGMSQQQFEALVTRTTGVIHMKESELKARIQVLIDEGVPPKSLAETLATGSWLEFRASTLRMKIRQLKSGGYTMQEIITQESAHGRLLRDADKAPLASRFLQILQVDGKRAQQYVSARSVEEMSASLQVVATYLCISLADAVVLARTSRYLLSLRPTDIAIVFKRLIELGFSTPELHNFIKGKMEAFFTAATFPSTEADMHYLCRLLSFPVTDQELNELEEHVQHLATSTPRDTQHLLTSSMSSDTTILSPHFPIHALADRIVEREAGGLMRLGHVIEQNILMRQRQKAARGEDPSSATLTTSASLPASTTSPLAPPKKRGRPKKPKPEDDGSMGTSQGDMSVTSLSDDIVPKAILEEVTTDLPRFGFIPVAPIITSSPYYVPPPSIDALPPLRATLLSRGHILTSSVERTICPKLAVLAAFTAAWCGQRPTAPQVSIHDVSTLTSSEDKLLSRVYFPDLLRPAPHSLQCAIEAAVTNSPINGRADPLPSTPQSQTSSHSDPASMLYLNSMPGAPYSSTVGYFALEPIIVLYSLTTSLLPRLAALLLDTFSATNLRPSLLHPQLAMHGQVRDMISRAITPNLQIPPGTADHSFTSINPPPPSNVSDTMPQPLQNLGPRRVTAGELVIWSRIKGRFQDGSMLKVRLPTWQVQLDKKNDTSASTDTEHYVSNSPDQQTDMDITHVEGTEAVHAPSAEPRALLSAAFAVATQAARLPLDPSLLTPSGKSGKHLVLEGSGSVKRMRRRSAAALSKPTTTPMTRSTTSSTPSEATGKHLSTSAKGKEGDEGLTESTHSDSMASPISSSSSRPRTLGYKSPRSLPDPIYPCPIVPFPKEDAIRLGLVYDCVIRSPAPGHSAPDELTFDSQSPSSNLSPIPGESLTIVFAGPRLPKSTNSRMVRPSAPARDGAHALALDAWFSTTTELWFDAYRPTSLPEHLRPIAEHAFSEAGYDLASSSRPSHLSTTQSSQFGAVLQSPSVSAGLDPDIQVEDDFSDVLDALDDDVDGDSGLSDVLDLSKRVPNKLLSHFKPTTSDAESTFSSLSPSSSTSSPSSSATGGINGPHSHSQAVLSSSRWLNTSPVLTHTLAFPELFAPVLAALDFLPQFGDKRIPLHDVPVTDEMLTKVAAISERSALLVEYLRSLIASSGSTSTSSSSPVLSSQIAPLSTWLSLAKYPPFARFDIVSPEFHTGESEELLEARLRSIQDVSNEEASANGGKSKQLQHRELTYNDRIDTWDMLPPLSTLTHAIEPFLQIHSLERAQAMVLLQRDLRAVAALMDRHRRRTRTIHSLQTLVRRLAREMGK